MIEFDAVILQFNEQGEKTGWSYMEVPADIAARLKPGCKKSFRVKGMLDGYAISGKALLPMGGGAFIMPLKADVRKGLRKDVGAMLTVRLEEDLEYKVEMPDDLRECFEFDPDAAGQFYKMPKSHQSYYIKWINDAKTSETRSKRIVNTVNAMLRKWDYGQMIREMRKEG